MSDREDKPAPKPDSAKAPSAQKPARKEWRFKKILRVLGYLTVVGMGAGLIAARSAYGSAKTSALALGHELGRLGGAGSKSPIRINGEPIFVATSTEDIPPGQLLDKVEANCRATSAGVFAELDQLSEKMRSELPNDFQGAKSAGVLREERKDAGFVACFVREGEQRDGLAQLVERLESFVDTGDLSKLGKLRYVFAEKKKSGKTHVVAAWTDGSFNIGKLVPDQGDAPGSDPHGAPRPPNAVRLLSAGIEGVPYGLRIYDAATPAADVIATYDSAMPERGWERVMGLPGDGKNQRAFYRDGVDLMIIAEPEGDRSVVSILEMRGR